jgi:heptosyltransferase-3
MREILVIRAGALGDGLLTLPALAALRARWPEAAITLVGPRSLLPFAAAAGFTDRGLAIEDEAGLALLGHGSLPSPHTGALAIVWLHNWQEVAARLRHAGWTTVLGSSSLPASDETEHVADHLFRALEPLGIGPSRLCHPLAVPPVALQRAEAWWQEHGLPVGDVVALHPGSGGRRKCWPPEQYADLARRLLGDGYRVLLCLGPAETEAARRWECFGSGRAGCLLAAGLELPLLAGVLRRCAGFVGNDAGVTHLAAALGCATVAIFGPTASARWAPLGRRVRVLRDPAWQDVAEGAEPVAWTLAAGAVERAWRDLVVTAAVDQTADTEL